MATFTTLRLTNKMGEKGGEWFADTITDYHYRTLKEFRREEPHAGWKLQTRGISSAWHDYEPTLAAFTN